MAVVIARDLDGKFVQVCRRGEVYSTPVEGGTRYEGDVLPVVAYARQHSPGVRAFASRDDCAANACARLELDADEIEAGVVEVGVV